MWPYLQHAALLDMFSMLTEVQVYYVSPVQKGVQFDTTVYSGKA